MAVVIPTAQTPVLPEATPLQTWRRQRAREMLTANLQEAQLSGPMRCTRSLTDVTIHNYKKQVRNMVDPRLITRHEEKTPRRFSYLKDVVAKHDAGESKNHCVGPDKSRSIRDTSLEKTDRFRAVENLNRIKPPEKGYTISEIHRIMKQCQTSGGDPTKISISIRRVSSAYPNVQLTVQGALQQPPHKAKDHRLHPNTRVTGRKINQSDALLLKSFVPRKRKTTSSSDSFTDSLKTLDSVELGSLEKTRQWLFDNPIGETQNNDVEPLVGFNEVETTFPVADGYAISRSSEPRSVRFGFVRTIGTPGKRDLKLGGL